MNSPYQSQVVRDQVCDLFEQQWLRNRQLTVEQFVSRQTQIGDETLSELIILEIDLRFTNSQSISKVSYQERFPSKQEAVEFGFERLQTFEETQIATGEPETASEFVQADHFEQISKKLEGFTLIRCVGVGGFGVVYKAIEDSTGEIVALKFPTGRALRTTEELRQLQSEAELAAQVKHPGIVGCFGMRSQNSLHFVVQQFVDGPSIEKMSPRTPDRIVNSVAKVADALGFAHEQGLIHRDIKPSNILINPKGHPLIADFGLAVHESAQRRLRGQRCGTPNYMSPEQVLGLAHQMDGRSDIWSLGVVLYELLSGRKPFIGETCDEIYEEITQRDVKPLRMVAPELDSELQRICHKCLNRTINHRYRTASELGDDLRSWMEHADRWQSQKKAPLIPRGVRPFEARDAIAFRELLPGPKDRLGIPDSIQFWKRKIERENELERFTVGAIMGPGGSGKSSFVRAGLLPHLDPALSQSIFVDAAIENPETQLSKELKNLFPDLSSVVDLPALMDSVSHQIVEQKSKPLLIVIDQFEQWLCQNPDPASSQLGQALRYCDGKNLYCLVLIRDDFWLVASRFFNDLNIPWNQEKNIQKLDLLTEPEGIDVLNRLGVAIGKLPEDATNLSSTQKQFLASVVSGVSEKSRVVCLHLTLFVEMFRNKEWSLKTINAQGGFAGIGESYLEDVFDDATSTIPKTEKEVAKNILLALLPSTQRNIRPAPISEKTLRSNLAKPKEEHFMAAIRWLVLDLRIVTQIIDSTPIDKLDENTGTSTDNRERYHYQLTHDSLVPSVRDWINRKKRDSWRGRAELRLAELTQDHLSRPDKSTFPSFAETIAINLAIPKQNLSPEQSLYLKKSNKRFLTQVIASTLAVATLIFAAFVYQQFSSARMTLEQYLNCPSNLVETQFQKLAAHQSPVLPRLERFTESGATKERLRALVAESRLNGASFERLRSTLQLSIQLPDAEFDAYELANVTRGLESSKEDVIPLLIQLCSSMDGDESPELDVRVRAALIALSMGFTEPAIELCKDHENPTAATMLTHQIGKLNFQLDQLLALTAKSDTSLQFGIILAVADANTDSLSDQTRNDWTQWITAQFKNDPHSGIHSACEYFLRKWNAPIPRLSPTIRPDAKRDWWVVEMPDKSLMTFVRVRPGSLLRGENTPRKVFSNDMKRGTVKLKDEFWIATTESQFSLWNVFLRSPDGTKLLKDFKQKNKLPHDCFLKPEYGEKPAINVSLQDSDQFVAWLNKTQDNSLDGNEFSFGVPVCDEWEFASRGGSKTMFHWGDKRLEKLQDKYGVYKELRDDTNTLLFATSQEASSRTELACSTSAAT